jgi:hypothetical protein
MQPVGHSTSRWRAKSSTRTSQSRQKDPQALQAPDANRWLARCGACLQSMPQYGQSSNSSFARCWRKRLIVAEPILCVCKPPSGRRLKPKANSSVWHRGQCDTSWFCEVSRGVWGWGCRQNEQDATHRGNTSVETEDTNGAVAEYTHWKHHGIRAQREVFSAKIAVVQKGRARR